MFRKKLTSFFFVAFVPRTPSILPGGENHHHVHDNLGGNLLSSWVMMNGQGVSLTSAQLAR